MQRTELDHWLRLHGTPGIGNAAARRLLRAFGTPEGVFAQDALALAQVVSAPLVQALQQPPEGHAALVDTTCRWLDEAPERRRVLVPGAPGYPPMLLHMEDPPLLLYASGDLARWDHFCGSDERPDSLAIVGSRRPTPQGLATARQFGQACAAAGWTVVSGLALGVDGAAHAGALAAAAADAALPATIAVVGTGLDRVYPASHHALAHAIAERGMLLSEYPLGTPPLPTNFPKRNRLIAGLARGTLVVEAALRSGSLITARLAVEQGKEVFAVPGSIHAPQTRGCHALIQQGAKLVTGIEDVFEEFAPAAAPRRPPAPPDAMAPGDDDLLEQLGHDPIGLDALVARTGLPAALLQARLLELELQGQVGRLPGALFQRIVSA